VFDIIGRRQLHRSLGNALQFAEQLNLHPGVYIVRITGRDEEKTKRIFVE
jgi:hypothetical protein